MKQALAITLAFLALSFAGCVGDDNQDTDPATPESNMGGNETYMPLESITGFEYVATAANTSADGIWLHDDRAYLSGPPGLRIVDIRNPAMPVMLNSEIPDTGSRDVDIMVHPDGNLYAVLSAGGVALVDVTNATNAYVVSEASVSSHNMAVVPNSTIVYNSRSISTHVPGVAETGQIDIVDFADPVNPVVSVFAMPAVITTPGGAPKVVTATTCHDITFNAERQRAYCAGVTDTQIWDIKDPANPVIIQVIDYPLVNIHHAVWDARGGDLLILGDEFAGAAAGPLCSDTVDYPTSALWFFDISDIETPIPVDYFQVDWESATGDEGQPDTRLCTTHFGTLVEGHEKMVMGWYAAGTVMLDFSGVDSTPLFGGVTQDAHYLPGRSNTWESREYKGHIYTGDTIRGMDVLKLI
jgi:hypothetical protein